MWLQKQARLVVREPISCILQFLVIGHDLACQQEVSLALTKTQPIHYYNVVDSAFSNYAE